MAIDLDANIYFTSDGHIDDPPVDHAACVPDGEVEEVTVGAAVTVMSLVELQGDGKWDDADASAGGAQDKLAFAMTAGPNDADIIIVVHKGVIWDADWNWTPGEKLYASATAGEITSALPVVGGDSQRVVAYAKTADSIYFNPVPGVFPTA